MATQLKKRVHSFGHAFRGIRTGVKDQVHLRIHFIATVLVIIAGCYFQLQAMEWIMVCFCIGAVISLELINSAIEYTIDLISPEIHPLAKKAKDVAAAAVLIMSIISMIIGGIIFIPYITIFCC